MLASLRKTIGRAGRTCLTVGAAAALVAAGAGGYALHSGPGQAAAANAKLDAAIFAAGDAATAEQLKWQCGPAGPAKLFKKQKSIGRLRACVGTDGTYLYELGVLIGAKASLKEQVALVVKKTNQADIGGYHFSPDCTTYLCVFAVAVNMHSHAKFTVLPEWFRESGNYQSSGPETPFIRS
jgi:hypothetical protein